MPESALSRKAYLCGHRKTSASALKMLARPPVFDEPIFGHLKLIAGGILSCSPRGWRATKHNQLILCLFLAPTVLVTTFYTYPQVTRPTPTPPAASFLKASP